MISKHVDCNEGIFSCLCELNFNNQNTAAEKVIIILKVSREIEDNTHNVLGKVSLISFDSIVIKIMYHLKMFTQLSLDRSLIILQLFQYRQINYQRRIIT